MSIVVGVSDLFSFGCAGIASPDVSDVDTDKFSGTGGVLPGAGTTAGSEDSDVDTDDVVVVTDDVIMVTDVVIDDVTDDVIADCEMDDVITNDATDDAMGVINDFTTGELESDFELPRQASPDSMFLIGGVVVPDKVRTGGTTGTSEEVFGIASFVIVSLETVSVFGAAAAIVSFTVVLTTVSSVTGARKGVVGRPSLGPGALTGDCVLAPWTGGVLGEPAGLPSLTLPGLPGVLGDLAIASFLASFSAACSFLWYIMSLRTLSILATFFSDLGAEPEKQRIFVRFDFLLNIHDEQLRSIQDGQLSYLHFS